MKEFAKLLDRLFYTHSNLSKAVLLKDYFKHTPDPDRGYALATIAETLNFSFLKRGLIKDLMFTRTDPVLAEMSYDYVGEMSETVAHLWTPSPDMIRLDRLPTLAELVHDFQKMTKDEIKVRLSTLLDNCTPSERWALLKLGTGGLRIGITARFAKKVLAEFGNKDVAEIEEIWHSQAPPYVGLFQWLEGKADKPQATENINFVPVMLSHPLEGEKLEFQDYAAEWKYDGIRVQLISNDKGSAIFTRSGDDISHAFPDLLGKIKFNAVLDGELLVRTNDRIGSFNDLQQRLNRKKPDKKLIDRYPAYVIVYDALFIEGEDMRNRNYTERRKKLNEWWEKHPIDYMHVSESLEVLNQQQLDELRQKSNRVDIPYIEGLMLKRKDSLYVSGRPKGLWYKWKRDPLVVDAVMMYAQRGHGKRSSFYSDYTFGCWRGEELLPVGKAYSGFTDEELKKIDTWVRNNTIGRFGPVREVEKKLVFELAFDSVARSTRHKSGVALRFPRVSRIRWDKPANEADLLETLEKMISGSPDTE
jgi:DNA ligase-1